ncbi:MAG TPA: DUF4214 domain-containing protein [Pirellulales bacterium]|nr:DUF4214 domain-containing protein [Pirellulales bacterium]
MFCSKKLFGRPRSNQPRRHRRLGRIESLEDRRMFNVDPHGGPVVPNVQVETLFYGASWYGNAAMQHTAEELNGYFHYLTGSSYMDLLSQYSTASQHIGKGEWLGGQTVNRSVSPLGGLYLDDSEIRDMINSEIYYGKVPQPNGNLVYFVFTDPNTEVTAGGENSIENFAGYHNSYVDPYDQRTVYYAVIPDPVGNGKIGNLATFQQQTEVASHELAEAITDPVYPTGWFDSRYGVEGEIGDLANGSDPANVVYLNNYAVQREWSNQIGGPAAPAGATSTPVQPLQVTGGFTLNETVGTTFNAQIGAIYDPNAGATAGAYTIQINWGDGTSTTGTAVAQGNGRFGVFGSHSFQSAGQFTVNFTVGRQDDGLSGAATSTASVQSPRVLTQPVRITSQIPINLGPGDYTINQAMVTFVDPNGSGSIGNYQATINWGDNQSSPGSVSFDAGSAQFVVSGHHTYTGPGTYTITVNISNGSAVPATTSGSITLTSPPAVTQPVQITNEIPINLAPGNFTVNQALLTFIDPAGAAPIGHYQAKISWGDGQTSAGSVSFDAQSGQFVVSGNHAYAGPGTYLLTVQIDNGSDTPATASGTITLTSSPVFTPPVVTPPVVTPPVVTPPVETLTKTEQYVTAVYHDVLNRAPDAGGLAYWSNLIDKGAPISSVADQIGHSTEYYTNFVIQPDYQKLLGRAGNQAEVQALAGEMQRGLTDQGVEAKLVATDEFFANAGSNNQIWVDAVYTRMLGRQVDAPGEAWWTAQLANGQSRSQVAQEIAVSQENNTQLINDDYFHYLGRAADLQGLSWWLTQFAAGKTNEDVIAGFTGGREYYDKHTA